MNLNLKFFLFAYFYSFFCETLTFDYDITIEIPSRQKECFYQNIVNGSAIDLNYQVDYFAMYI